MATKVFLDIEDGIGRRPCLLGGGPQACFQSVRGGVSFRWGYPLHSTGSMVFQIVAAANENGGEGTNRTYLDPLNGPTTVLKTARATRHPSLSGRKEIRTSNIQHPTPNIQRPTSNCPEAISKAEHPVSLDVR